MFTRGYQPFLPRPSQTQLPSLCATWSAKSADQGRAGSLHHEFLSQRERVGESFRYPTRQRRHSTSWNTLVEACAPRFFKVVNVKSTVFKVQDMRICLCVLYIIYHDVYYIPILDVTRAICTYTDTCITPPLTAHPRLSWKMKNFGPPNVGNWA